MREQGVAANGPGDGGEGEEVPRVGGVEPPEPPHRLLGRRPPATVCMS